MGYSSEQLALRAAADAALMEKMNAYIGFSAPRNASEMADVPPEKMSLYAAEYFKPVHGELRVPRTRWCVLRYPTPGFAQSAAMSTEAFEDFFFDVCTMDYARMDRAMDPLKALLDRTDRVRIVGPGTDLSFSIKGIGSVKCAGENNIPDGEIFTAPVRDSVNGTILYNAPSTQSGFTFENVRLRFENGRIVEAGANDSARVNQVFDVDEGARYVGEFRAGRQPIRHPPDEQHALRRKDFRQLPLHARNVLRRLPQRQPFRAALGPRLHPDARIRRRRNLVRRRARPQGRPVVLPELEGLNPENLK